MSILDSIRIVTDPGMQPGTWLLHSGICDWGDRVQGREPHKDRTLWRLTAGCEHEHLDAAYLCGPCGERAQAWCREGRMLCRACSTAGERAHDCPVTCMAVVLAGPQDAGGEMP